MKNLQSKVFAVVTIICMLVTASSCGGGGGGGGMGGSSGEKGATVMPASNVNTSNNASYGFSKNSIVVSANSGTSALKTPAFLKTAQVKASKTNTTAKGAGIYSEAIQQMGIAQINLSLTIDGVTTEYKLNPNDALVLKQITSGTKIVASGTVETKDKITRNIVQKEYDIESFQDTLPLFVEYKATLKDNLDKPLQPFTYSTDKPIELPVLNDITVQDVSGAQLGVAPFLGWQVNAPNLSIHKNFYAKGATVPAGELCGDIEFYADYGFCVYQGTSTIIEDAGIELFAGGNTAFYFVDVKGTPIKFESANVTNSTVASFAKSTATTADTLTAKALGNTSFVVTGNSLRGNTYTVQIPVTVKEATDFVKITGETITGQPDWAKDSEVFIDGRTITIPTLWVSDHEVTQGEYTVVMGTNPSTAPTDGVADNNPVNYVSWFDAIVYCNKRSIKEDLNPCYTLKNSTNPDEWGTAPLSGETTAINTWNKVTCDWTANGYRLPTEAEWEYLARGKEAYTYSGSDNINDVAWYKNNSKNKSHEVKTKQANAFGLYDMSGNVAEFCWDVDGRTITASTPDTCFDGGSSPLSRVVRGGIWGGFDTYAPVARRSSTISPNRRNDYGFRVVRTAK